MYPEKPLAQIVIAACQQRGIAEVVISPGSRNAPLTVGFHNHPDIQAYSVVDERCAAFFALGIAQQQQRPVALVCTSGSALLNYYPAVAEAFYSKIPLVVISADRPAHLIDRGDGQTIRQKGVFANHILAEANLEEGEGTDEANAQKVMSVLRIAKEQRGPVHINVPFDEPLYTTVPAIDTEVIATVAQYVETCDQETRQELIDWEEVASVWTSSKKKLVLIGVHDPSAEFQRVIDELKKDPSVLIMTETTSNIAADGTINSIDQLITPLDEEAFKALQPDLLVTMGGLVVSKRIKQFLRAYKPKLHWHVDALNALDTYFCLTQHIAEYPWEFFPKLLGGVSLVMEGSYQQTWLAEKARRILQHKRYMAEVPFSDLWVFQELLSSLPKEVQLQISNSSSIRYAQLFSLDDTLTVFCNRGTSGIDGSTSTAVGAAVASDQPTVLITGDVSFYYDSNALWNQYIPASFRIVILNNSGGGIFKIIPGPKKTNALEYFETPHSLTAEHLAMTYGFGYRSASTKEDLEEVLIDFYATSVQPQILEVFTPAEVNDELLKKYFKNL